MAVVIDRAVCRGCGACVDVCPGDLIELAPDRAYLRSERECWMCLSCAKVCPRRAIKGRLPFVLADSGASLWPEREGADLRWICEDPSGARQVFVLKGGNPS